MIETFTPNTNINKEKEERTAAYGRSNFGKGSNHEKSRKHKDSSKEGPRKDAKDRELADEEQDEKSANIGFRALHSEGTGENIGIEYYDRDTEGDFMDTKDEIAAMNDTLYDIREGGDPEGFASTQETMGEIASPSEEELREFGFTVMSIEEIEQQEKEPF